MRPGVRGCPDRRAGPHRDQAHRIAQVGALVLKVDLHTHSTASDGLLTPARLVVTAREHGVGTLALTDHDTTAGLEEALAEGRRIHIDVIP
ncbi:MAG TPA: PHP domain-containing protein, partial [bacterium]|nr:PHP domain-containing protein [bacterium]